MGLLKSIKSAKEIAPLYQSLKQAPDSQVARAINAITRFKPKSLTPEQQQIWDKLVTFNTNESADILIAAGLAVVEDKSAVNTGLITVNTNDLQLNVQRSDQSQIAGSYKNNPQVLSISLTNPEKIPATLKKLVSHTSELHIELNHLEIQNNATPFAEMADQYINEELQKPNQEVTVSFRFRKLQSGEDAPQTTITQATNPSSTPVDANVTPSTTTTTAVDADDEEEGSSSGEEEEWTDSEDEDADQGNSTGTAGVASNSTPGKPVIPAQALQEQVVRLYTENLNTTVATILAEDLDDELGEDNEQAQQDNQATLTKAQAIVDQFTQAAGPTQTQSQAETLFNKAREELAALKLAARSEKATRIIQQMQAQLTEYKTNHPSCEELAKYIENIEDAQSADLVNQHLNKAKTIYRSAISVTTTKTRLKTTLQHKPKIATKTQQQKQTEQAYIAQVINPKVASDITRQRMAKFFAKQVSYQDNKIVAGRYDTSTSSELVPAIAINGFVEEVVYLLNKQNATLAKVITTLQGPLKKLDEVGLNDRTWRPIEEALKLVHSVLLQKTNPSNQEQNAIRILANDLAKQTNAANIWQHEVSQTQQDIFILAGYRHYYNNNLDGFAINQAPTTATTAMDIDSEEYEDDDEDDDDDEWEEGDNEDEFAAPLTETPPAVPYRVNPSAERLLQIRAGLEQMSSDNTSIGNRFAQLAKQGNSTVAQEDQNKPKNRYRNILPKDAYRVQSQEDDAYYINASYVPNLGNQYPYIAAQAPLTSTIADFWRMIWEQNAPIIAMVTNLQEKGQLKADRYWPTEQEQSLPYGPYTITWKSEQSYEASGDYIERTFELSYGTTTRTITQLHYTGWPDFGVPTDTQKFLNYYKRLKQLNKNSQPGTPIVAHCSAGCGRTGVLIALDYVMEHILNNELPANTSIEQFVINTINHMRHARDLVQTEDQLQFIYTAVMAQIDNILKQELNLTNKTISLHRNNLQTRWGFKLEDEPLHIFIDNTTTLTDSVIEGLPSMQHALRSRAYALTAINGQSTEGMDHDTARNLILQGSPDLSLTLGEVIIKAATLAPAKVGASGTYQPNAQKIVQAFDQGLRNSGDSLATLSIPINPIINRVTATETGQTPLMSNNGNNTVTIATNTGELSHESLDVWLYHELLQISLRQELQTTFGTNKDFDMIVELSSLIALRQVVLATEGYGIDFWNNTLVREMGKYFENRLESLGIKNPEYAWTLEDLLKALGQHNDLWSQINLKPEDASNSVFTQIQNLGFPQEVKQLASIENIRLLQQNA